MLKQILTSSTTPADTYIVMTYLRYEIDNSELIDVSGFPSSQSAMRAMPALLSHISLVHEVPVDKLSVELFVRR